MGNITLNEWLLSEALICNPNVGNWAEAEWPELVESGLAAFSGNAQ